MAATLKTSAALVCSIGCVRKNNEDNFYFMGDVLTLKNINEGAHIVQNFTKPTQMYAVLDGMGGQNSGERASCIAAELLEHQADKIMNGNPAKTLVEYAHGASKVIYEDGISQGLSKAGQGTTLAVLCLKDQAAHVANVGDSRVYVLRQGELRQVSQDHSLVGALYRTGQITELQARLHPKNNVIEQFIGMDPDKMPKKYVHYVNEPLFRGDRFMLCSDGLTDLVPEGQIRHFLANCATPDEAASKLVMAALELGGKDNTTCIILDYGAFKPRLPLPAQTAGMFPGVVEQVDAARSAAAKPAQKDKPSWFTTSLTKQAADKAEKSAPAPKKTEDTDTSLL